jgi:hypothetical protein
MSLLLLPWLRCCLGAAAGDASSIPPVPLGRVHFPNHAAGRAPRVSANVDFTFTRMSFAVHQLRLPKRDHCVAVGTYAAPQNTSAAFTAHSTQAPAI